ncbi:hypothetical protein ALC62_10345, partial [Cyphomyrmex costatus]
RVCLKFCVSNEVSCVESLKMLQKTYDESVYKTLPENINDLRQRIVQECRAIPANTFKNVRSEFQNRLYCCLANNGEHFEHLL